MLRTVGAVIVDEIHAVVRDKRGSHLALSLERLDALTGRSVQRIGLSATQKPLEDVGRFLVGAGRECALVDAGTFRELDLGVEVPPSPLSAVCSHEQWEEIYTRMAELVREHRTTLVFVNTRKMAERIAAQLTKLLGEDAVTSHHGSLSKERRLDAEQRLKAGQLRALVATASLELGIDIGDVDLVIQVGATRSIATFLQRVGPRGPQPPTHAARADLPADARRARGERGAVALRARGPARPNARSAAAARHPGPADRRRLRRSSRGPRTSSSSACAAPGPTATSRARISTTSSPCTRAAGVRCCTATASRAG